MPTAPDILTLTGAVVTPTQTDKATRRFSGAVHTADGRLLRTTQRNTGRDYVPTDPEVLDPLPRCATLPGRSVYLGQLPNHYGHFLIEGLARAWALEQLPAPRWYVCHRFVDGSRPRALPYVKAAFAALGIPRRRLAVIDRPTRCEILHVPTPLFRVTHSVRAEYIDTHRRLAAWCRDRVSPRRRVDLPPGARLYLSRRGIPVASRGVANEEAIERLFESFGFTVLHPERLDFCAQLALYGEASVLAGFTGSALHNILYCRPGTRLIDLGDPRGLPEQNLNQRCCDWIAGARAVYVPFRGERTGPARGAAQGSFDLDYLCGELQGILGGC